MNATPPETDTEYSRAPEPSRGSLSDRLVAPENAPKLVLGGGLLAALLLVVAEFTALYSVHVPTSSKPIATVTGGAHNAYALLPVAVLAVVLAVAVYRSASRPALLALVALGVLVLAITLIGDLPDTHAHGLTRSSQLAGAAPGEGLYLEALAGILLVLSGGLGALMLGGPWPAWRQPVLARIRRSPGATSGRGSGS